MEEEPMTEKDNASTANSQGASPHTSSDNDCDATISSVTEDDNTKDATTSSCECDDPGTDDTADDCVDEPHCDDNDESCVDEGEDSHNSDEGDSPEENDPYAEIAKLGDDLALARADLYNLRNEYNNYVRRSKKELQGYRERGQGEVLYALISVLDDIHAAREAGDLQEGPFAAIAEKLEKLLETNYQFSRFGNAGDPFDPTMHDALMAQENSDITVATIHQVVQPGYKKGDNVMRPTKVIVDNPA